MSPKHITWPWSRKSFGALVDGEVDKRAAEACAELLDELKCAVRLIENSTEFRVGNPAFQYGHAKAHKAITKADANK